MHKRTRKKKEEIERTKKMDRKREKTWRKNELRETERDRERAEPESIQKKISSSLSWHR